MKISAAIFDCDGTILDSMPMWNSVFVSWLKSHHIPNAAALAHKYEYMNFQDECYFFHDNFGVGDSREAALAELQAMVRRAYERDVVPFKGAKTWLKTLRAAHIPMIVASSTTVDLLEAALSYHGLRDYFEDILYTGDIGADKTHPDVYLAACKQLGQPLSETWVFEDAPFGVQTAYQAGFPTVCMFNDHDGRDETFLRNTCDLFIHGYPELSLELLADYERPRTTNTDTSLNCLIIGGSPAPSSVELVRKLAQDAEWIVAADRGAEVLRQAGITPDVFCGDDDTVSATTRDWARSVAHTTLHFPPDKYATDLAIALQSAQHEATRRNSALRLTLSCVSGGRPDHQLGVWGNLTQFVWAHPHIVEDSGQQRWECRLLSPEGRASWDLTSHGLGKTVSVVALAPDTVVSETGMRWNVDHKNFELLADVGISNEIADEHARISCHQGMLACFVRA